MHMDADEETAMADLAAIAAGQPPPSQQALDFTGEPRAEQQASAQAAGKDEDSDDEGPSGQSAVQAVRAVEAEA